MPRLVFIDHEFVGQVCELTAEKTTVGRADHNNLVIHHASVSSDHGQILVNGTEVIVCDFGSRNGTFVEGRKIDKQSEVRSGQTVRFGSVAARLDIDPPTNLDDATAITAVFSLRNFERHEAHHHGQPEPEKVSMQLGAGAPGDSGERTLIIPRPPPGAPTAPAAAPTLVDEPPRGRLQTVAIIVAVVLVLGLALLAWLRWGRT